MNEHQAPEFPLNGFMRWHAATRRQATRDRIIRSHAASPLKIAEAR